MATGQVAVFSIVATWQSSLKAAWQSITIIIKTILL